MGKNKRMKENCLEGQERNTEAPLGTRVIKRKMDKSSTRKSLQIGGKDEFSSGGKVRLVTSEK